MSKTKIKNLSNFKISIILPNVRFARDINPQQEVIVPEDVIEEINYDPGCRSFIQDGFLAIISEDENIKEQMLKSSKTTAIDIDVDDLLKNQSIAKLSGVLKDASPALKDLIVERAVALSIADEPHNNVIMKFTGTDVIKAIELRHTSK